MRSVCILYGLHLRALTAVEMHQQSYGCLVSTTSRSFGVIVTVLVVFCGSAALDLLEVYNTRREAGTYALRLSSTSEDAIVKRNKVALQSRDTVMLPQINSSATGANGVS